VHSIDEELQYVIDQKASEKISMDKIKKVQE